MSEEQQENKAHRVSHKTSAKKKLHQDGQNKKAFSVNAPGKMKKMTMRSRDLGEKKLHVPMADRTPDDDPPPVIVAVVGPPGTGKSTLIKSLIRRFTKQTLTEIKGPITLVSGKRRRLTIIEVGNDLNTMIDTAKVADLVLLMMDGNFGLEMETMEFLNIIQHHGMPRVLGVATHLDLFKKQSTLRASKKRLKQRFWTEVYQGAKLFYLSGVMNGRYPDREILNLSRFISVLKFRPLKWRNEHPYLLADRMTDLTHPLDVASKHKIDRKVALYGYLHGTPLPPSKAQVHIAGVGDFSVEQVEKLPDPCPTPYFEQKLDDKIREEEKRAAESGEKIAKTTRRRKRLDDKQKIIYAPMSDVGGILVDKDAVYINTADKEGTKNDKGKQEEQRLVTELQDTGDTIEERFDKGPGLQLFSSSKKIDYDRDESASKIESDSEIGVDEDLNEAPNGDTGRKTLRKANINKDFVAEIDGNHAEMESGFDEANETDGEDVDGDSDDHENYHVGEDDIGDTENWDVSSEDDYKKTAQKLKGSIRRRWNINTLLYLPDVDPKEAVRRWNSSEILENSEEDSDEEEDNFFRKKDTSKEHDSHENSLKYPSIEELREFFNSTDINEGDEDGYASLRSKLLTAPKLKNDNGDEESDEESMDGGFEDLENQDEDQAPNESNGEKQKESRSESDSDSASEEESSNKERKNDTVSVEQQRELNAAKKAQLQMQFEEEEDREFGVDDPEGMTEADTWYEFQKNKMAKQKEINKAEYENMDEQTRIKIEGYKAGSYVRLVFKNLPCEFVENFQPKYPVVVGGLLPTESRFGIMNARIRRHRWHKKILKSQDPLILSLGWRRFQTLPIYTTSDSRTRNRMLKYTPEHAYCFASFYGPFVAPGTPFLGFNIVANSLTTGSFRISATGVIEDLNSSVEIFKKLKLVGYPYNIFRNTAFIKDMFSNSLEVAKFEGASLRTVSGIRGEIKRALSNKDGNFRATFEDKILMSDIVFLKTWYPVKVKKMYNPVCSLLLKNHSEWQGMKLTGQVRSERGIELPSNPDSNYEKIERPVRKFNPLRVPKSIQSALPFQSQIHHMKAQKKPTYLSKRAVVIGGEERKARDLMQKVATIRKEKESKTAAKKGEKFKERLKAVAKENEIKSTKEKQRKKEFFAKNGKKRPMSNSSESIAAFGKRHHS